MSLTESQVRSAKPRQTGYRLPDDRGLFLWITPQGGRHWRYRYKIDGREKVMTFGPWPEVSIVAARKKCDAAREQLREGLDPTLVAGAQEPFQDFARRWVEMQRPRWTETHTGDVLVSLERDVFPVLGPKPIGSIKSPAVLDVLRAIETRGAVETAHRVRQRMSAVFTFAMAEGKIATDPAAPVRAALKPVTKGRQPAVVTIEEAREVLKAAEMVPARPETRLALRLLALTSVRPGEIRGARWIEFTLDDLDPVWIIPAVRMKMKREHVVPLSRQAVETMDALRLVTGRGPLCFPSARQPNKSISENAIGYLINRAGYHGRHVPHGWRAAFSSIMNERRPTDRHIIDAMLAHVGKDKVEAVYNRAQHLALREKIAQEWADILLAGFPSARDLLELRAR
jgi:integrase